MALLCSVIVVLGSVWALSSKWGIAVAFVAGLCSGILILIDLEYKCLSTFVESEVEVVPAPQLGPTVSEHEFDFDPSAPVPQGWLDLGKRLSKLADDVNALIEKDIRPTSKAAREIIEEARKQGYIRIETKIHLPPDKSQVPDTPANEIVW